MTIYNESIFYYLATWSNNKRISKVKCLAIRIRVEWIIFCRMASTSIKNNLCKSYIIINRVAFYDSSINILPANILTDFSLPALRHSVAGHLHWLSRLRGRAMVLRRGH